MRRVAAINNDEKQITTVKNLTGVFESISSTRVAKVKDKAQLSKEFFDLLWRCYASIRFSPGQRITERDKDENARGVFVVIAAETGLSGDIDQRLINTMLKKYDSKTTDLVVIGSHGANQLVSQNIRFLKAFKVPEIDTYIDVKPVVDTIKDYSKITVFYEDYVSLGVQDIKSIDLVSSIRTMSQQVDDDEEIITSEATIFEPSIERIADEMESTMLTLAINQVILDSSLAQSASRFNAMAVAKKKALEMIALYKLEFHRAKRSENDRRMHEVMVSIKKKRKHKK